MSTTAAVVEVCGEPVLEVSKDYFRYTVVLHSSDSESGLHAEICLYIRAADGYFWFEPSWLL